MSYQVFARKYRPQTFNDLVGQGHVVRTLRNAITQNRLAHAYLFVGPRGVGKTSTARILAKALNCVQGPTVTPCGECDSCREIAGGNSLDVLEIDGASNNGVEQVRELRDNVRYAPSKGHFKIYVIDEVHMLSTAAFNALLKTLEEPPAHVKFIFATTEPQKVLPTILSRCQRFDLHRIPANLISKHLLHIAEQEKISLDSTAAHAIAKGADGGLRDAESMLDQLVAFCGNEITEPDVLNVFGFTGEQTVADFTGRILRGETAETLDLLHAEADKGKDMMKLMSDLITYLRDLLVCKAKPDALAEDLNPDLQKSLEEQAAMIETDRLLELIDQFAAAEARMKWVPNKRLHFEVAVIKAIQTLSQVTLNEVIENLAALRGGSETTSSPPARPIRHGKVESTSGGNQKTKSAETGSATGAAPDVPKRSTTASPSPIDPATDPAMVWEELKKRIPPGKKFIQNAAAAGHALGVDGRSFLIGFAPDQKSLVDMLGSQTNRKICENILNELTGSDWTLKLSVKNDLAPRGEVSPEKPKASPAADFKNDPRIREALEVFKGEIRTVND